MNDAPHVVQSFRERRPTAALARYVACVWVQEVAPGSGPYRHRTVPNGAAELVCELGKFPRVHGPTTGPTETVLPPGTTVVGVRLRAGAAPAVLGVPASDLVDLDLGADELWGTWVERLAAALSTDSPGMAAARLEGELLQRLTHRPPPDPLVMEAVQRLMPGRAAEVSALASDLFVSERHLRRRCETAIGLAPKTLQRMLRFQRFLALASTWPQPSTHLARLAVEAGYADQPHLTREALRLEGRSPRVLLLEAEQKCGPAHDHRATYGPLLRLGRSG